MRFFQPHDYSPIDYTTKRAFGEQSRATGSERRRGRRSVKHLDHCRRRTMRAEIVSFLESARDGRAAGGLGIEGETLESRVAHARAHS
jgi:hypothetical protein